jgi:P27 family predicted phage terminase small subunit
MAAAPRRPAGLGDQGQRLWRRIWAVGAAWLDPVRDYELAEQACRYRDDAARFRKRVKADGDVGRGSQGQPVSHPLIGEARQCEAAIRRILDDFGLTPTAAARLGLAVVKTESKLDELAARRQARERGVAADTPVVVAEVVPEPGEGGDAW